jgi:acetyl esterase/lipase
MRPRRLAALCRPHRRAHLFSCGTLDPLLDDTLFMACRWKAAGSPVRLAIYPGAPHEFLNLHDAIPVASDARERMVGFVDRVLSETGRSPEPVSLCQGPFASECGFSPLP